MGITKTDSFPNAQEFDVFTCPLDGVTQIEASAGTGKTWNICALYIRLLLEKALSVEQILVVTFTKAATAELYERIRARLALLVYVLSGGDAQDEPFVKRLLETTVGVVIAPEEARLRLEHALHNFDQAAIHTIHGFCQRALQEAPFAAALPFEFEWVAQDEALRFELAIEFWRAHIEPAAGADSDFAKWLAERGAMPAALDVQLKRHLQKPLAHLVFDITEESVSPKQTLNEQQAGNTKLALTELFEAARTFWQEQHQALAQLMDDALSSLKATSYKPATLTLAFASWHDYFAQGEAQAPLNDKASLLAASTLATRVKKGCVAPTHPFFELADTLLAKIEAAQAEHTEHWLTLLKKWLNWAPAALRERKQVRRVMSFDDLLANLQSSLVAQPWLAQALKRRYPAALIDEFQDTDPLQFDIFNRIFAPHGPLFLVGDPKQAIYSFRAADLHTYLAARKQARACYTLATNQRSTASLIAACNRLFSRNPAAFVLDGLTYQAVHAGRAKQAPFVDHDVDHAQPAAADLYVWRLPQGEEILSKNDALRRAAHACAAEIVRLLKLPATQQSLGDAASDNASDTKHQTAVQTGLNPRDIAVIVQTHRQGNLIKRALAQVGIGSVEVAQISVFSTPEAQDLESVLHAIVLPSDARRLRGALTVDWFGVEASTLAQLDEEPNSPPSHSRAETRDAAFWAERFTHYRGLWQTRGFAVMWRMLSNELQIAQRIAAGPNGERRLADLAHLTELMQTQAALQPNIAATMRWLSAQRTSERCDDEMQVRLESDKNLVQIVTVHKSKGLEYAVVFCPFLYDGTMPKATYSALPNAYEYHDANSARAILHYGGAHSDMAQVKEAAKREQQAERARLIYVALTRAVYRCYLVSGLYTSGASASTKEARGSMLNWLIAGAGYEFSAWLTQPPPEEEINAAWQALADETIKMEPLPMVSSTRLPTRAQESAASFQARPAHRFLRESWQIASFTSLTANREAARERENSVELLADYDAHTLNAILHTSLNAASTPQSMPTEHAVDDILNFPRGAAAGECLHRLLELVDFAKPDTWPAVIERAVREYPLSTPVPPESLHAMMMHLLHDLALTELTPRAPGLTLSALDPARRQTELEFTFPACGELNAVRQLLTRHGYADIALPGGTLHGYLKGFIDLVFEYQGRFWLLDWKSHHLGETAADYEQGALSEVMAAHGYHLQALIYTLALHRYLRIRLPDYDYATHFGGYLYLFVRGVRPTWRSEKGATGVYIDTPDFKLIDALDRLLQEREIVV